MSRALLLAGGAVAVVVAYIGSHLVYNAYFHPLSKYPGPFYMTSTRLGFCQKLLSGFLPHTVLDLHKKYGPVVRIAPDQLSYAHPDAWKDIMGHHGHKKPEMGKYPRYYYAHPATPTHIMNAGRDDHSQMRKIFSHGFSEKAVREQEPIVQTYVDLFIKRLGERADGRKLDMASAYNYLFFDVIGNLAFGEDYGCLETYGAGQGNFVNLFFESAKLATRFYATSWFPNIQKLMEKMFPLSKEDMEAQIGIYIANIKKLKKRMASEESRPDLIQSLLDNKEKLNLDILKIEANCTVLVAAGSETSSTTMCGMTYLLLTNPDCLKKLTEEVRGHFRFENEINFNSCQELPYLKACIDETLRLYPAAPGGLPRMVPKGGATIAGEYVPEDTAVEIYQYAINRTPHLWTLPNEYHPERWLEDPKFANDQRESFQPFHVGPRSCLGRHLTLLELRSVLARLVWKFDMSLDEDSKTWIEGQQAFDIWHKSELNVHLTPVQRD